MESGDFAFFLFDFVRLNFSLFRSDPNKTQTRNFRGSTGRWTQYFLFLFLFLYYYTA